MSRDSTVFGPGRPRLWPLLVMLLAPTRAIMNWRRRDRSPEQVSIMLVRWTRAFFWLSVLLCAASAVVESLGMTGDTAVWWLGMILTGLGLSRCNETVIAFAEDASQWLARQPRRTSLSAPQRLRFVIQSYGEIWLWFALIIRALPGHYYSVSLQWDIATSIYFSGVTITTVGYGDIHPTAVLSRFLALYEAFSGLFLVVVAIGIYLSGSAWPDPQIRISEADPSAVAARVGPHPHNGRH